METMSDSSTTLQARLNWVKLYQQTGDAGLTCRRCGISRPTLRKWWRRYQAGGVEALRSQSRRPHNGAEPKVTPEIEAEIMSLRTRRNLGPKRIQSELLDQHRRRLSTATIWKGLHRSGANQEASRPAAAETLQPPHSGRANPA